MGGIQVSSPPRLLIPQVLSANFYRSYLVYLSLPSAILRIPTEGPYKGRNKGAEVAVLARWRSPIYPDRRTLRNWINVARSRTKARAGPPEGTLYRLDPPGNWVPPDIWRHARWAVSEYTPPPVRRPRIPQGLSTN